MSHTYDLETQVLKRKADMHYGKWQHALVIVDKCVYACGGRNRADLADMEVYSRTKDTWVKLPDLAFRPAATTATLVGYKIWITGAKDVIGLFNTKSKASRVINIPLQRGPKCFINMGSYLYIITSEANVVKAFENEHHEEMEIEGKNDHVHVVQSNVANVGRNFYFVDSEGYFLTFNSNTGKVTQGKRI